MRGRLHHLIVDCPDPAALARFYSAVPTHIRCEVPADRLGPPARNLADAKVGPITFAQSQTP